MSKKKPQWPPIFIVTHRSGQISYQVDLGLVEGKRKREPFRTKAEAEARAAQARVIRANEGTAAFSLPARVRLDAAKAVQILAPHGVTILESARYYEKHVLAYKDAPLIKEIVERYLRDCEARNLRPRTIGDLRHRLTSFAEDFGNSRLSDITLDELTEWVQDDEWEMRTRINFLTKISQLYGYAIRRKWVDTNLSASIDRPAVDDAKPEIFTVEQADQLLTHANEFKLLPYIALGFFAGLRSAEMGRLDSRDINFDDKTIRIGSDVAKKRAQRNVDMQDSLLAWLNPCKEKLKKGGPLISAIFARTKRNCLKKRGFRTGPVTAYAIRSLPTIWPSFKAQIPQPFRWATALPTLFIVITRRSSLKLRQTTFGICVRN